MSQKSLVRQNGIMPTRKLSATAITGFVSGLILYTVEYWIPGIPDAITQYVPLGVGLVAGWLTQDRANV